MEQVEARLEDVVFQSDDGMFCVLRLESKKEGRFTAVYRGPAPFLGENLQLDGYWVEHSRYGRQLAVQNMQVVEPTSAAGIEAFLSSGAIKGVGKARAAKIVAHFGVETLDILGTQPERLAEISGISARQAAEIGAAYGELSELRTLMLFLESHGISSGYASKIQAVYGNTAIARIKDNPYRLAQDIDGIGFTTADRIALGMGLERDCLERLKAGISYALTAASGAGHTCVPEALLVQEAAKALQVERDKVQEAFNTLMQQDLLRTEEVGGLRLIYPEYLYRAEVQVARRLLLLRDNVKPVHRSVNVEQVIASWEREAGISLAPEQQQAIHASLENGVLVLTGGPGTGKTTVVKGIINVLERAGCRILLAAPTGRAARRLAESSGRPAKTVHRLLEYQPNGGGLNFGRNEEEPLDAEAIIVDEASMLDIRLTYNLLRSIPGGCRLILVGDVDQLPSVGPGSVLKDIIRSEKLPVVRLANVFRQAQLSTIVRNAHKINAGQLPEFTPDSGDFSMAEFAEEQLVAEHVADCYTALLQKRDDWRYVQVLSPMHKNPCGVQALNALLQERVNPPAPNRPELAIGSYILRLGDKVMQIRNNYEKDVFNGDIGQIVQVDSKGLRVFFPDRPEGELVAYTKGEAEELQLAYTLSVHKSQGSEYAHVLLVMVPSHYIMLQRNLFYTAVTRAKEQVRVIGSRRAVQTAVLNDKTRRRYSLLAERLQESSDIF